MTGSDGTRLVVPPVKVDYLSGGVWVRVTGIGADGRRATVRGVVAAGPQPHAGGLALVVRDYETGTGRDRLLFTTVDAEAELVDPGDGERRAVVDDGPFRPALPRYVGVMVQGHDKAPWLDETWTGLTAEIMYELEHGLIPGVRLLSVTFANLPVPGLDAYPANPVTAARECSPPVAQPVAGARTGDQPRARAAGATGRVYPSSRVSVWALAGAAFGMRIGYESPAHTR